MDNGVRRPCQIRGPKIRPACHQRDSADITEFVTLVQLSSLGQHVGVLALARYKRRKSALTAGPIETQALAHACKETRHIVAMVKPFRSCGDVPCRHNSLASIPPCVCQLQKLSVLLLSHNKLTELPVAIGQLTQLEELVGIVPRLIIACMFSFVYIYLVPGGIPSSLGSAVASDGPALN